MTGGNQYIDQITMELRNVKTGDLLPVYINVYNNSLSHKWLQSLNRILEQNLHLEKNYCFMGFDKNDRNLEYICDQINETFDAINQANIGYTIEDHFSPETAMHSGPVGSGLPGLKVNHDKFNLLHRYFEDLQGTSSNLSKFYIKADASTKWHIRQLNLLCHEAESLILSMRKAVHAPDWRRPSQLMCWLNAPRFTLDENDYELFGIDALSKDLGGVFVGVNKAVGKHHWEVYNDEGRDSRIDELVTTTLNSQTEAAGDFDVEWAQETKGYQFWQEQIDGFVHWLTNNGFDPDDKSLTIGHPKVAQVDLEKSFGTENFSQIWDILYNYLDVYTVSTSDKKAIYNYHWSDSDFKQRQIDIIGS